MKKTAGRFNYKNLILGLAFLTTFQTCNNSADTSKTNSSDSSDNAAIDKKASIPNLKPMGSKPDWGKDIDDNMQVVIEKLASYGDPPIVTVSAQRARQEHTPSDAVMDVMKENNILILPEVWDKGHRYTC